MPTILFVNLKGGVAKTTTAVATAECLASQGFRTLLIDADHQCMAGELLLGEMRFLQADQKRLTLHDLLAALLDGEIGAESFGKFVVPRVSNIADGLEKLGCMPCSMRIDDFATDLSRARQAYRTNDEFLQTWQASRTAFRHWLSQSFDYTIIDCPPSIAVQVKFLMGVADHFVVPCVPEHLSVRGALYLMNRIAQLGLKVAPLGTLWTLYRAQNPNHVRTVERAGRRERPYDDLPAPFATVIPNASRIAQTAEAGKKYTSFRDKYGTPFAELFEKLVEEIRALTAKPKAREAA